MIALKPKKQVYHFGKHAYQFADSDKIRQSTIAQSGNWSRAYRPLRIMHPGNMAGSQKRN